MKQKKRSLLIIFLALIICLSGCTKYLTDEDKKRVTNESTGQAITSNILCLPESDELTNIYEKHKDTLDVDYDSLNVCSEFLPSDISYNGLWETIFIKPLAWIIIKVGLLVGNYGIAVMILGLLIRIILIPLTKKSLMQSEKMKKAQTELNAIQKKYEKMDKTGQDARMQMSQETMMVYQKYGINPLSGCLTSFIQIPLLLAFLEAINRVPAIFEEELLTLQLGTSPLVGIKDGNMTYLLVLVLIVLSTYYSYKKTMNMSVGNASQNAQTSVMMKFMVVFIAIASLSLPTALSLYWITTNLFMIVQNKIVADASSDEKDYKSERTKNAKIINRKGN